MPNYEITVAGRMGPVMASCLPGFRSVAPSGTVLHALASNHTVVLELLGLLADHHCTVVAVRIDTPDPGPAPGMSTTPNAAAEPTPRGLA